MHRLTTKAHRLAARYIPKDSTEQHHPEGLGVVYLYDAGTKPCAIAFRGTAGHSDFHTSFRSVEQRAEYVQRWESDLTAWAAHRGRLASQRKAHRTTWKVGTILEGSWGYDQTNIEFYQVVALSPSGKTAKIRELQQASHDTGYMQGRATPKPDAFRGPAKTVRIQGTEGASYCRLKSYCTLSEWNGQPAHWTAYA